jgi:AraC-like DNA-binding protein
MGEAAKSNDYDAFRNADMAFHRCIAEIADVPALVAIWDVVEAEMRAFVGWAHRWVIKDLVAIAGSHEWHFTAIRDGHPKSAERAAEVGLDSLWQILAEQPAETLRETDPLERVCAYVLLNLHMPLSLQAVARDVAFLSPSHLAKQFREVRKESFTAYVQGLRQRRAAHLLATTDLSIQAIIDRVGAPDLSRFAGQFRRAYGCTPSGYKRRLRDAK